MLLSRVIAGAIASQDPARVERALRWLYHFIRPYRARIGGQMLLALCATSLVLVQPWLTKALVDDGLLAGNFPRLLVVIALMVGAGLLGSALAGLNRYLYTRLSAHILFDLREALYAHLQRLSPAFFARFRIGDLLSRLNGDVAEIQRFAVDSLFSVSSSLIGLAGSVTLMFALSWKLALLLFLLVPVQTAWLRWMRRKVEHETRLLRERSADVSSFFVEKLPATKFVQSAGQEDREHQRLQALDAGYITQLLKLQIVEFATQAVPTSLTSLCRAAVLVVGGYWVITGQWELGSLLAFTAYLGMAVGPVQSLLGLYVAVQRMAVSLGRIWELREVPMTVESPAVGRALPPHGGAIALDDVWFTYPERRDPVLRGVTLTIPARSKVALTGQSGTGKTTLIDLLQRFADPDRGSIRLDGIDLRELDLHALRRRIVVVSQDLVLFRGTLAENIAYAVPAAGPEAIATAARRARLDSLVSALPDGLDSLMAEHGQRLSGGQRQRIALARALLQDPVVLVLDEATSEVDEATEREIIDEIDRLFRHSTRIVISHRAATLAGADVLLHLQDGRIDVSTAGPS